jgi:hypothetical protein
MALITLADWTCQINRCVYPLDREGLSRSFTCFIGLIPAAWIIIQNQMSKLDLSLCQMDQSHLLEGHYSISHALSLIKPSIPQAKHPTGHAIRLLGSMGFHLLSHCKGWNSLLRAFKSQDTRARPMLDLLGVHSDSQSISLCNIKSQHQPPCSLMLPPSLALSTLYRNHSLVNIHGHRSHTRHCARASVHPRRAQTTFIVVCPPDRFFLTALLFHLIS